MTFEACNCSAAVILLIELTEARLRELVNSQVFLKVDTNSCLGLPSSSYTLSK